MNEIETVRTFLRSLEDRNLDRALSDGSLCLHTEAGWFCVEGQME
jgi:hypothetical protein